MNKTNWKRLKFVKLIFVIFVSGLALYIHQESVDFDPVKEIQRLKSENRRDDALDMVKFFKENEQANPDEIKSLEMDLEYSTAEKFKSLVWDGSFKGQVHDTYSGLGSSLSDLILFGDIRDLVIQSWKYLSKDSDYDKSVMLLSGAGIGLSSTTFINGTDSMAKSTIKYVERYGSTSAMVQNEIEMLFPTISMPVTVALFDLDETDNVDEGGDDNGSVSVSTSEQ